MADDQPRQPDVSRAAGAPSDLPAGDDIDRAIEPGSGPWATLWQVPTILVSIMLIGLGVYIGSNKEVELDFDGALDQAEQLTSAGEFDQAAATLNDTIRPMLDEASIAQQARYHTAIADWIYLSQDVNDVSLPENNQRIVDHYSRAANLTSRTAPTQLERWALTQLEQGDLEGVEQRLIEIDILARTDPSLRTVKRRLERMLAQKIVADDRRPPDERMAWLDDYRARPGITAADEGWAIARQAELRLAEGAYDEAAARLLIEMRRLEQRLVDRADTAAEDAADDQRINFGELYTLLALAYYNLGEYEQAGYQLDAAMARLTPANAIRGLTLTLLGHLAVARDDLDLALERYDEAVRDYDGTAAHLEALLARAQVHSILGRHDRAEQDFVRVQALMNQSSRPDHPRTITRADVAAALIDRHDAALMHGDLGQALEYARLAESQYGRSEVPPDVLLRIAATSRQLAEDLVHATVRDRDADVPTPDLLDAPLLNPDDIPPAIRAEANTHYLRAAEYFVEHARRMAGLPGEDDAWAESLWLAGESYDAAGNYDLAISHFREYIAGRPTDDPRRAEGLYMLARAHQALFQYEEAIERYTALIDAHPTSPFATRSYVPLAQCYIATDRKGEAERELREVVMGNRSILPDAIDYREAHIALARLHYDNGQWVEAIEELDKALKRYPDDRRANENRYRLAYSYMKQAEVLRKQLEEPARPSEERAQLRALRREYLTNAEHLFGDVIRVYEQASPMSGASDALASAGVAPRLDRLQADLLRYAYLYRADCAFELGEFERAAYERAIDLYDRAARKYVNHHSSMTALIQIVVCYHKLGDPDRAQTAHRRAMVRLEHLNDDAFEAPDALMDRRAWERWLTNMPVGADEAVARATEG